MKCSTALLVMGTIGFALDTISVFYLGNTASLTTEVSIYASGAVICKAIEGLKS